MIKLIVITVGSYFVGSIPFSIIISQLFKKIDIREYGSKNPGATNVFRVLGPGPGVLVLLLDVGKGFIVVWLSKKVFAGSIDIEPIYIQLLSGVAVTLGHIFSIFASFKGGKGIAVVGGALLALIPHIVLLSLVVFGIILALTRYVSLGSLSAAIFINLSLIFEKYFLKQNRPFILILTCLALTLLVFYTHRGNIKRLLNRTEHKIGQKVKL